MSETTSSPPPLVSIERHEGEQHRGVVTLWMERADKRNALDAGLMRALAAALDEVRDDPEVRVVVLRGRGPVFSSGIDHSLLMEVFQKSRSVPFLHLHHDLQDVFHRIERMQQPVIAAMQKLCIGMAFELALACDFRLATADCVVGLPEIAFGIVPDVGGTTRLSRLAGPGRARELVLTGKLLGAAAAQKAGLITDVAWDEADLSERVGQLSATLVGHPKAALRMAKTLVQVSLESDSATSFRLEGLVQQQLIEQPDLAASFPRALAFIQAQIAAARGAK